MTRCKPLASGALAAALLLASGAAVLGGGPTNSPSAKAPKTGAANAKSKNAAAPGRPDDVPQAQPAAGPDYGADAIAVHRNAAGQTVYSISASHFDVSRPLREMAATAPAPPAVEGEPSMNPHLPRWRTLHSGARDTVVQPVIAAARTVEGVAASLQPTAGFNFAGVGSNGGTPSDSNGSVGNNQFVEIVNTRYQIWSLNRATNTATSILGPLTINTLWSGFGGACQTQNSGDPIVLYDKIAGRWLISQFTSSADSSGIYYQCVALSTTSDATGTYGRWAFPLPTDPASGVRIFGDYPHFGVWTDAYYMMAHGFGASSYIAALFAALDRPAMLQGSAAATWQVIQDTSEGGHMPADVDGFAPPPTNAPGIFVSLHTSGMAIYRMKVDFATPANTIKTLQAMVPVAAATGACELASSPGTCVPQPGSSVLLDALGDRLMFRAAYRNFVDHESLVVSHSVDPSVTGVVSGVRWYDFRLSGTPDATCPTYPCIHQQGTIADVDNGRSRWMPSVAMDAAENIMVGYSVTGKSAGSDNHSLRYTGRAKSDPPGTMTVPEFTIATGDSNESGHSRWGDYSSMSVDPYDDCTLWYVGQYYLGSTTSWSTRIASTAWPTGGAPGQCPAAACTARPAGAATGLSATATADNEVTLSWTGVSPAAGSYAVERAEGSCAAGAPYQPIGATTGTSFVDRTVQGGLTYSYRVIAAADAAGRCQSLVASACVETVATGACTLKPVFTGALAAASNDNATCGVNLTWASAASSCPLTPAIRYSIFRGTTPDFVPSTGNRIATCVPGPSSYIDVDGLTSGATYYYVVRAEDSSAGHGGECGGGNEESNSVIVSGTPYGPGVQTSPGVWTDGGGDGDSLMLLNAAGDGDTKDPVWRFVRTADDAGANHTPGGAYAYRNAGPQAQNIYSANTCSEMRTPPLTGASAAATLQYWERHDLEYHWDGVAVEYSRNGGAWTSVPAPSNSTAAGCAAADATSDWQTLECTLSPPINGCGYVAGTNLYNGPLASGSSCSDYSTSSTPTSYAHRCHPITGLAPGDTLQFRWRFTSDPGAEYAGFYLDDVAVTNIRLPNACTTANGCHVPSGLAAPSAADASPCTSSGIAVSWSAPAAWGDTSGPRTFTLRRDGAPIVSGACAGSLPSTMLSCLDAPGDNDVHAYTVTANNGCGANATSAASLAVADKFDATPPAMTVMFLAKTSGAITFTWSSAETGAAYTTYRSPASRPPSWSARNVTTTLSWNDAADLGDGASYFYTTTAKDACGNESLP